MIITNKLKAMITRLRARVARLEELFDMFQKSAFGELMAASRDPEIQISAQYDTSTLVREVVVAGGTTEITGGEFTASSGTNSNGLAAIFSDNLIISKPGQGTEIDIEGRFDAPVVGNRQAIGAASASDGVSFTYQDLDFGVCFIHDGRVQVEELTVTTAGGSETAVIGINGTNFNVILTVGPGTVQHTAAEIADSLNTQVALYNFTQNNDQVVARSVFASPETAAFTFSSPGAAVAAWVQISDGVTPIDDFIPQADWNVDKLPDLDPLKNNAYKVVHNGDISYYVLDGAIADFVLVHRVVYTNVETTPMFSTASFRLVWSSTNSGSTTNITVRGTRAAAFNQGRRVQTIGTQSAFNVALAVGTTPTNVLTIRCREVYGTKVNLGRILPAGISAATDGNKGAIIQVIKNATFSGNLNFAYKNKAGSIAEIDKTAVTVSGGEVLASLAILTSISLGVALFKNVLLPGDTVTLAMNVPSGGAADMDASVIWEEDL